MRPKTIDIILNWELWFQDYNNVFSFIWSSKSPRHFSEQMSLIPIELNWFNIPLNFMHIIWHFQWSYLQFCSINTVFHNNQSINCHSIHPFNQNQFSTTTFMNISYNSADVRHAANILLKYIYIMYGKIYIINQSISWSNTKLCFFVLCRCKIVDIQSRAARWPGVCILMILVASKVGPDTDGYTVTLLLPCCCSQQYPQ